MSLPDYEDKDTYTKDDVEHVVARRLAAIQLQQLQNGQIELRKEIKAEIAEIKVSIKELVDAWNSAGTMVRMVKYAAAFVSAVVILIGVVKGYRQ